MDKPEFVTEEHLEFLDWLREDGATNMYGARPYIEESFPELDKKQATQVLIYWMETFAQRQKED